MIGGSISFKKGFSGEEHEYFLSSAQVPAAPGVLVPWCKVFHVQCMREPRRAPLFSLDAAGECRVYTKLQLNYERRSGFDQVNASAGEPETPEPPSKRRRCRLG